MINHKSPYEHLKLADFEGWEVYLHENQCFLGRCYLLCKDESKTDLFDISQIEREELFLITSALKKSLSDLFKPDRFNYAALGNVFPRLHLHIIPRYKTPRIFCAHTFKDERWGQNYAPYDKSFVTPEPICEDIKHKLRQKLFSFS